jgi:high-affinity K+ transport system ATPase subunit B
MQQGSNNEAEAVAEAKAKAEPKAEAEAEATADLKQTAKELRRRERVTSDVLRRREAVARESGGKVVGKEAGGTEEGLFKQITHSTKAVMRTKTTNHDSCVRLAPKCLINTCINEVGNL